MKQNGVRQNVLTILEDRRGESVSGQEMAARLGVSRAAVCKAVMLLRQEGYSIDAVTRTGYRLRRDCDVLSEQGIRARLKSLPDAAIAVRDVTDSTNADAMRLAAEGAAHGSIVAAERQSAGRGRLSDRTFFSPPKGMYMSVILRPNCDLRRAALITPAAAVASAEALRALSGKDVRIKWVNDLYFEGKKICGILSQATADFESGLITSVVVGIGINLRVPRGGFPREIADKAGALYDGEPPFTRNALIADIRDRLLTLVDGGDVGFMRRYKQLSLVVGKRVSYEIDKKRCEGVVTDIRDDGALIVAEADGERVLNCGEISVCIQDGWL